MSERRFAPKLTKTMVRDPGPTNKTFFGFVDLPARGEAPLTDKEVAYLPGRRGAAERDFMIEAGETDIHLTLTGWATDKLSLNERQLTFLRDYLTRHFAEGVNCARCGHIQPDMCVVGCIGPCPDCPTRSAPTE